MSNSKIQRQIEKGIKDGENTKLSKIVKFENRLVDRSKTAVDVLWVGMEAGASDGLADVIKLLVAMNLVQRTVKFLYQRKSIKSEVLSPVRQYPPSDANSKSLRYFSSRNRSDGTQSSEERQVTLQRSLLDPSRKLDLAKEEDRLQTYERWTYSHIVDPRQLASRGFEYLGDRDRVRCVFCRGILRDWRLGDDPLKEHHKHFPTCPFILHLDVGNVPKLAPFDSLPLPTSNTEAPPESYEPCLSNHDSVAAFVVVGVRRSIEIAECHEFGTLTARLDTFRDEDGILPSRGVFAAAIAGFYFASDEMMEVDADTEAMEVDNDASDVAGRIIVRCYACEIQVLFAAVTPNEPAAWWAYHARKCHTCPHIKLYRGTEYAQRFARVNASAVRVAQQIPVGSRRHRVEPREVRARLDFPMYVSILAMQRPKLRSMEETRELLGYLIDERLEITGQDFESVHDAYMNMDSYVTELNVQRTEFPEMTMTKFLNGKKEELERQREELKLRSVRAQQSIERGFMESFNPLRDMDDEQLSEFNRQLKDNRTCKICMDRIVNTVFLPCGHLVTCHECAPKVKMCPVCRLPIASTVLTSL